MHDDIQDIAFSWIINEYLRLRASFELIDLCNTCMFHTFKISADLKVYTYIHKGLKDNACLELVIYYND